MLKCMAVTSIDDFYSHASCEARRGDCVTCQITMQFLLTRLLRGATYGKQENKTKTRNFYSHASCEARLLLPTNIAVACRISTHTPRAGRDRKAAWRKPMRN